MREILGRDRDKDEDEEVLEIRPFTYYEQTMTQRIHHFYLSVEVGDPSLYIEMIHRIRSAQAGEVVIIHLNMIGGDLSTGVQIINAMDATEAHVIVSVEGEAHSLGTLIFLSADEFVVHDNSMMMFHNFSGGTYGKGNEQKAMLDATILWFNQLARERYVPFMSEEELQSMLDGKDLWMQSDEIRQRLQTMVDQVAAEHAATVAKKTKTAPRKKKS